MSNIPQFAGSLSNLGTQIGTGWTNSNTPVFISYNSLKDSYKNKDWNGLGQGFQLFLSQLVKYQAPDSNLKVSLISN
jgi:hypothetical protein